MGMKEWIQLCVPFFLRKKKSDHDIETRSRRKWTKKSEGEKRDGFKSGKGGVAFNVELPDHSGRPKTAAGTPRPGSSAHLMKLEGLDGETRYKEDVYKRRDALLQERSSKIRVTTAKKRAACLQRKAQMEKEFRCQSRNKMASKAVRRERNLQQLEVAAKGSRGRVRLYSAVRRAHVIETAQAGSGDVTNSKKRGVAGGQDAGKSDGINGIRD